MSFMFSTYSVHTEVYRGYEITITRTDRVNSPLMDTEFMAFIAGECVRDEIDTQIEALEVVRKLVDRCVKLISTRS